MNFRDELDREITSRGLSVTEIARISRMSKGAIYNILNGKTEEARIRPATKRAIAAGCGRELEILENGGARFVDRQAKQEAPDARSFSAEVAIQFLPDRPFLEDRFLKAPFDWLQELEEAGVINGVRTVDRVFQKRTDFLSILLENQGSSTIDEVWFDLNVKLGDEGPSRTFGSRLTRPLEPGERFEETLFVLAGPQYSLNVERPGFKDAEGQIKAIEGALTYHYKG